MSKKSVACCKLPVIQNDYQPRGQYVELDGVKTYLAGASGADKAIFVVYDIFGFFNQTLQGADILADGDTEGKYQVYVPDFFEGQPASIDWYPPDTQEKGELLSAWFENASPQQHLHKVPRLVEAIRARNPAIKDIGIMGYCWGGKMASILASEQTFKAAVQTSPALIDEADAKNVVVPMMMLLSKDESTTDAQAYEAALTVPKHVTTFESQIHGFMSARADLEDETVKKEYEQGYLLALNWFREHL